MKKVLINGQTCIGPTFTSTEFSLIRKNLAEQKGLESLAETLAVAGNAQRLRILYLLYAHREMCVCDLAEILDMTVSAVSQHLRKLKDKRLVTSRRKSQTIYYALSRNPALVHLAKLFAREEIRTPDAFVLNVE